VTYHGLPFLLAGAFVLIAALPKHSSAAAVAAFGLAGLGCSALLPLTISIGQEKLAGHQAVVAGVHRHPAARRAGPARCPVPPPALLSLLAGLDQAVLTRGGRAVRVRYGVDGGAMTEMMAV
jgi:hypothetical protein